MEPYIVLAQKNILFHGIWRVQHRISESLIKSIGASIPSTPSRACKLLLTSAGVTLFVLPSADGKSGKTDQVSFDSLRDIVPNQYCPKCLMIIYVDSTNKFAIMACSSENERDIEYVSKAFRDHQKVMQHQRTRSDPQSSVNSLSRLKPRFNSDGHQSSVKEIRVRTNSATNAISGELTNGSMVPRESYDSSQRSDSVNSSCTESADREDVFVDSPSDVAFDLESVFKKPVNRETRPAQITIGTQTSPSEEDSDVDSMTSPIRLQIDTDDVFWFKEDIELTISVNNPTGIRTEEYDRRGELQENGSITENQNGQASELEISHINLNIPAKKEDGNNEDYEARSIGIQTLPSDKTMRRYTKKQINAATVNAYKERMATRKKRSASANSTRTASHDSGPVESSPIPTITSGSTGWPYNHSIDSVSTLRPNSSLAISMSAVRSQVQSPTSGSTLRSHNSSTISGSKFLSHTPHSRTGLTAQVQNPHTITQQRMITDSPFGAIRPVLTNTASKHCSTVVKSIEDVYNGMSSRRSLRGRGQRVVRLASGDFIRK